MDLIERFKLLQQRAAEYAVQSDQLRDEEQGLKARLDGVQEQRAVVERGKSELRGALSILKEQIEEAEAANKSAPKPVSDVSTIADAKAKKAGKA